MTIFKILLGDITKLKFDAIVNAANTSLLGGGGVDGSIHKACGNRLLDECRELKGCMTGNSKITQSYDLTDKGVYWVIHTVGPIYRNNGTEEKYLRSAYRTALNLAADYSSVYTKQYNNILENYICSFKNNELFGEKKKEILINECNDYIKNHPIKTLAFPSISTGAYGYPLEKACTIALDEITTFINNNPEIFDEIAMVCYDQKTYDAFTHAYNEQFN
ncbi:macro domain-containing protein [Clostridium sp. SM-530-WT-3G]|uniref:macro domain-containing protein n=1 Tax=Clostridium sp. SM-530-WT-3G TaxID=2725303 RepID=UPI00145DBA3F|nr:macro domain-containing protein [Clostridium sp. SM-530-WT-3G]NME82715.1 Appr-1-p processing protein [Clostridium sp. SM-530-WT-3G]